MLGVPPRPGSSRSAAERREPPRPVRRTGAGKRKSYTIIGNHTRPSAGLRGRPAERHQEARLNFSQPGSQGNHLKNPDLRATRRGTPGGPGGNAGRISVTFRHHSRISRACRKHERAHHVTPCAHLQTTDALSLFALNAKTNPSDGAKPCTTGSWKGRRRRENFPTRRDSACRGRPSSGRPA